MRVETAVLILRVRLTVIFDMGGKQLNSKIEKKFRNSKFDFAVVCPNNPSGWRSQSEMN
jgi:hypothetical protein